MSNGVWTLEDQAVANRLLCKLLLDSDYTDLVGNHLRIDSAYKVTAEEASLIEDILDERSTIQP